MIAGKGQSHFIISSFLLQALSFNIHQLNVMFMPVSGDVNPLLKYQFPAYIKSVPISYVSVVSMVPVEYQQAQGWRPAVSLMNMD